MIMRMYGRAGISGVIFGRLNRHHRCTHSNQIAGDSQKDDAAEHIPFIVIPPVFHFRNFRDWLYDGGTDIIQVVEKAYTVETDDLDIFRNILVQLLIDSTENGVSGQGNPLFEANPGRAPCNVLAMLAKLGHKTAFMYIRSRMATEIFPLGKRAMRQ